VSAGPGDVCRLSLPRNSLGFPIAIVTFSSVYPSAASLKFPLFASIASPTMFQAQILRQFARTAQAQAPRAAIRTRQPVLSSVRPFSHTPARLDKPEDHDAASTSGQPGQSGDHEGQFARTEESIVVEYPEEDALPRSLPVQGRGAFHFKRTLATFSSGSRNGRGSRFGFGHGPGACDQRRRCCHRGHE
jgi:hypothetical protein